MKMPVRFYLGSFLMTLLIILGNQSVHADTPAPARPYKKISENGEFVFAMLVPRTGNCMGYIQNCEGYFQSGLYRKNMAGVPLWTIGWYAHDIEISSDGEHLVRKGPWASDYEDEAVSFFSNGKLLRSYTIEDLVHFPWLMPHSVSHFMWRSFEEFSDSNKTYAIRTLHGEHYVFDVKTGKIISSCWIYLWLIILLVPPLFGIRLLISKNVYLFCISCLGIIILLIIGFIAALVAFIGLWAAGVFLSGFFDPSYPWSIKYLAKANQISATLKTVLFFGLIIIGAGTMFAIQYKFSRKVAIHPIPHVSLSCMESKFDPSNINVSIFVDALSNKDLSVVDCAIRNLLYISDSRVIEALTVALKDKDVVLRRNAAFTMGHFKDNSIIKPLSDAMNDVDKEVRLHAVRALSEFIGVLEPLRKALNDTEKEIRETAVNGIIRQVDDRKVDLLRKALEDRDKDVREAAIMGATGLKDSRQKIELLIKALKDKDNNVRRLAAQYLEKVKDKRLTEYFIKLLEDSDAVVRRSAVIGLGRIRDKRSARPLIAMLKDGDKDVRSKTAWALDEISFENSLGHLGARALIEQKYEVFELKSSWLNSAIRDKKDLKHFIHLLEHATHPNVRKYATMILGTTKDKQAFEALVSALNDKDKKVRNAAAQALGDMGDPSLIERLGQALNVEKNGGAALALSKIIDHRALRILLVAEKNHTGSLLQDIRKALRKSEKNPDMVEPLIVLLEDEVKNIRSWSALALGMIGDPRGVEPLIAAVQNEDNGAATWALGYISDRRAVEPLIDILENKKRRIRYSAAEALGKIGDPRAIDPLISSLKDKYSDIRLQKESLEALGRIGGQRAVETLVEYLDSSSIGIDAACALGKLQDERALQPLIKMLNSSNKWHRKQAAAALGELGDKRAVAPLISVLKQDQDTFVRMNAVISLGKLKDHSAIQPLNDVLEKDKGRSIKEYVFTALVSIDPYKSVEFLIQALTNQKDSWIRSRAAFTLGELKDRRAVEPLISILLNDKSSTVRQQAALALGEIGGVNAEDALINAMNADSTNLVRATASVVMEAKRRK